MGQTTQSRPCPSRETFAAKVLQPRSLGPRGALATKCVASRGQSVGERGVRDSVVLNYLAGCRLMVIGCRLVIWLQVGNVGWQLEHAWVALVGRLGLHVASVPVEGWEP